jgi:hypothetical protein
VVHEIKANSAIANKDMIKVTFFDLIACAEGIMSPAEIDIPMSPIFQYFGNVNGAPVIEL